MKASILTSTALCALLLPSAWSQVNGSPDNATQSATQENVKLTDARKVIERYAELTGVQKMIETTTSSRMKGELEIVGMGIKGPIEILSHKSNKLSLTIDMTGAGKVRQGFDGETAWSVHPMMGAVVQEGSERLQTVMRANYAEALKMPASLERLETVARMDFEGKDCWKLMVVAKLPEGMDATETRTARTTHEYYDVESGLLIGRESIASAPTGDVRVVTTFSEYKQLGPRLQPTVTVQKMTGQEVKISTTSVTYDDIEDHAFDLPEEIRVQVDSMKKQPVEAGAKQ